MKKSITKELGKEIEQKKKLPTEIKNKMNKRIFRNLIFAISIILYFISLNLGFFNIEKSIFSQDTEVFAITSLIIAIVLFEKAYRGEKGYLAIHGLEILAVALFTLFIPYTYFYLDTNVVKVVMLAPLYFAVYYIVKSAIIFIQAKNKQKNKISDVKEIVKKETRKFEENIEMDKDKDTETVKENDVLTKAKENSNKTNNTKTAKKTKTDKDTSKKTTTKSEARMPKTTTAKTKKAVKNENKEDKKATTKSKRTKKEE